MMGHVLERAAKLHHHYKIGHEPIMGGDNQPIPFYDGGKGQDEPKE
jgi:hypothetical protein